MAHAQQALIRNAIKRFDLTRETFARRYGVALRSVNAWLLPDGSAGCRKAPEGLIDAIAAEMKIAESNNLYNRIDCDRLPAVPVTFVSDRGTLTFPPIFLRTTTALAMKERVVEIDGKRVLEIDVDPGAPDEVECVVSFSEGERSFFPAGRIKTSSVEEMTAPAGFRQPTWVIVQHHESAQELSGYLHGVNQQRLLDMDAFDWSNPQTSNPSCINGRYYSTLVAPAPAYFPHSLLVYCTAEDDNWRHCVTETGEVIDLPEPPDAVDDEGLPTILTEAAKQVLGDITFA